MISWQAPSIAGEDLLERAAGLEVGARGRELHHGEALDEVRVETELHARDLEVLEGARGLDAVVRVRGHRQITEQIVLDPRFRRGHVVLQPSRHADGLSTTELSGRRK